MRYFCDDTITLSQKRRDPKCPLSEPVIAVGAILIGKSPRCPASKFDCWAIPT
jgi:hypothetical protein